MSLSPSVNDKKRQGGSNKKKAKAPSVEHSDNPKILGIGVE